MTDNRTPEVDPRYDPAFQRHGSGAPAAAARTRWADPVPVRAERVHPAEEMIPPPPDGIEQLGLVVADDQDADVEIQGAPAARRWELAILVTGIVLVVGGLSLGSWAMRLNFTGYSVTGDEVPVEFILSQFGYQVAPALVMVGVASLVGLLFLRAARAGGRR